MSCIFYALYNNSVIINGIEFDDPRTNHPIKRDVREYKEGVRTTIKEMWVDSYVRQGSAICRWLYCITMTNRGVCTFDGKPVKDENEKNLIKELFENVSPV